MIIKPPERIYLPADFDTEDTGCENNRWDDERAWPEGDPECPDGCRQIEYVRADVIKTDAERLDWLDKQIRPQGSHAHFTTTTLFTTRTQRVTATRGVRSLIDAAMAITEATAGPE